jgi:Family of unknown function (DUF5677)
LRTIDEVLEQVLNGLPQQMFSKLLREKLDAQGVRLSPLELETLAKEILLGGKDTFLMKRDEIKEDQKIILDFSANDIEYIEQKLSHFCEHELQEVVVSAVSDVSPKLLADLKERWPAESQLERQDLGEFRKRLYDRWQLPLERLRMLLAISREFGEGINHKVRQSSDDTTRKYLVEVLTRSHARACQIAEEILCLLEGGFADGAMARWRTLHEVAVVASFIADHGEDLAERYVLHQAVEANRAATEYQRFQPLLGYEPIKDSELRVLRSSHDALIARFGTAFKEQHGWAAHHLKNAKPNFADIERAVGIGHLRVHYRMASHNVHASSKGVFFKLGLMGDARVLLAGPSNAGLADPGDRTAWSLAHISATVATLEPSLDNSMILQVIVPLMTEIGEFFFEEHKRLAEEVLHDPHPIQLKSD